MRREIRFLLGHERRAVAEAEPTMTVLEYLRQVERRFGTKEGCAEGDCGACTVVLAEAAGERLCYRAVNACIQFLPSLDGRQLLTVEDLAVEDLAHAEGTLHPVQQAMADSNGTQCGFCTPGFVMSLFAASRHPGEAACDVLAGNLCRCTGYGPILEAASAATAAVHDSFAAREEETLTALTALADGETIVLAGERGTAYLPGSLAELEGLAEAHPQATLVAGATDVGLWVTKQLRRLDPVIFLGRVPELLRLEEHEGQLEIGAAVPYAALEAPLGRLWPDFGELLRRLGSRQVRNLGTMGGNVANGSPIGDSPPALIALGATLLLNRGGRRRSLPLEDFFLSYGKQDREAGEFLEAIRLPLPKEGEVFRAYKVAKRFDQDITAVLGCFNLRLEAGHVAAVRIAYGGMAATPKRALACEAALLGAPWSEASIAKAAAALADDFTPIGDHRASADYRRRLAANLLRRCFLETSAGTPATRLLALAAPAPERPRG